METYFNENLIAAHNGTNFVVEKITKYKSAEETYIMSMFKYKADVLHSRYNHETPSAKYLGDCASCGWNENTYDNVTWGDVLYLGLYLGCTPEYIYSNKSITSIDVVEEDQEIIDYVTWLNNSINIVCNDEWSYATLKKYDIIICDLWAESQDVLDNHKETLLNNYSDNLKAGGKLFIPLTGEILN